MSELSFDELQAETGELLPERETLGTVIIGNYGSATATSTNFLVGHSFTQANTFQEANVLVAGSFNQHNFSL